MTADGQDQPLSPGFTERLPVGLLAATPRFYDWPDR